MFHFGEEPQNNIVGGQVAGGGIRPAATTRTNGRRGAPARDAASCNPHNQIPDNNREQALLSPRQKICIFGRGRNADDFC